MKRPVGLGRGLSALIEDGKQADNARGGVATLPIDKISPNPDQPRRHFDEGALEELAQSIAERGVLQPILVRNHDGGYQIIAGERRWRAAQQAQLHEIPAIIRDSDDGNTAELALIENVQREDLNALEEAKAYAALADQYGHSQADIGRIVGKSRSHVANLVRLLDLPEDVQSMLIDGDLSMGHARALIGADEAVALAKQVISQGLSVRETEKLVKSGPKGAQSSSSASSSAGNPDIEALERQLGDLLGLKVKVAHGKNGGKVQLSYRTLDQLDLICQRLTGEQI
ncbi:ParB/RepB/Spo0J family partition protein [Sphingomicrobium sediminis]|uniref:ParB/RepB/Spo0J family partition protein n=1 Tax=Sphingomicrobium sediminis TaxID=2950949 RepID=A0A9X2EHF1_9SPHN|nr:ParB/RepB/Spo0J family partition protein [Sphingomicrobium sediminis]MCM8558075.1 ParB/RepB/Spo0J family partition protein [Sphingomicrobium sediminis]